jgi:hypothetical protein
MRLSKAALERAAEFIIQQGRGLERARYRLEFEEGSIHDVDDELRRFRNMDGGFGHGLEPDFRCPESSAAATVVGLEVLSETGAPPESDLVQGAISYLIQTYDPQARAWQKVPASVNQHPHAEWWHYPDGGAASDNPAYWGMTNAACVAFLHDYSMLVPADFLETVTDEAVARLAASPTAMDKHAFGSFQRLAVRLDADRRAAAMGKLSHAAAAIVDNDPRHWNDYVASPLWIAPTRLSPLMSEMVLAVDANLDFEIRRQQADGSWRPRWRWQAYPEHWAQAEIEWAGIVTLETLVQLRDYGRIEGL